METNLRTSARSVNPLRVADFGDGGGLRNRGPIGSTAARSGSSTRPPAHAACRQGDRQRSLGAQANAHKESSKSSVRIQ